MQITTKFFSIILFILATPCHANEAFDFTISPSWDSQYVTEGISNLDSGGLFSVDLAISKNDVTFGLWLAKGDSEDYEEIHLYSEYAFSISQIEGYLNLKHLIFPEEASKEDRDNEIGVGLSYSPLHWLQSSVDTVWTSEAKGGYVEVSLRSELITDESLYQITPYVLRSYDFGYASDSYDGINHTAIGAELSALVSANTSLELGLHYSWAGKNLERDDLGNESWINIGLNIEF